MARVDDLIGQVKEEKLRRELQKAVAELKKEQKFGLVFEEHLPEVTLLDKLPIEPGATVVKRTDPNGRAAFRVLARCGDTAEIASDNGEAQTVPVADLLTIKRFGEPIYPTLTPLDATRRGPADRPSHAVINGENFHALQLLLYLYEGQADCLYLDPPYNTGARDWKYNNRYVDSNDGWRHSKWLSMMEKRLRLALRLLKPDGIAVITIDDYEVHHLRMLLETKLPDCRVIGTVVIKTSPSGRPTVRGFRTNHEYAFFVAVSPNADIKPLAKSEAQMALFKDEDEEGRYAWVNLRKRGGANTHRNARPKQYYPIYVKGDAMRIPKMQWDKEKRDWIILEEPEEGEETVYPIGDDGRERIWSLSHDTAAANLSQLTVKRDKNGVGILRKLRLTSETSLPSTWWEDTRYSVVEWGTGILNKIFGTSPFPFSKSVHAVADCLRVAAGDNPDALIIDVFAGSGTTYNAACLLNAEDEGRRRTVLVTNNEVEAETARKLQNKGIFRGDAEYEANGIFEMVTRPRCEAVTTGKCPDGTNIPGKYTSERTLAEGFEENVAFFRLDYLDPDSVELGRQFRAVAPLLWLAAGGVGEMPEPAEATGDYLLPPGVPYGVLFRESCFREFAQQLHARPDITHVWLVTDSEPAFAEMRAQLPGALRVGMLYRDYLRNFRINTER